MEDKPQKWEGLVSAKLPSIQPDQAWSLLGDFFSLNKFLPTVTTCRNIDEGSDVTPGCVRYCEAEADQAGSVYWAKEKLVTIDPIKRSYSYVITENNMGFGSYFATLRVVEGEDGGCKIEWMFDAEPVVGWTRSGFFEYMEGGVKEMGKRVDALCVNNDEDK